MPSPRIIVIQHVAHEPLGTLQPLLKASPLRIRYVNFSRDPDMRPELDGYDGLILLGGAMCLRDSAEYPHLNYEIELIQKAVARGLPVLGICLGAQLIARALGATVQKNSVKEIGWYDVRVTPAGTRDALFQHFCQSEHIFQWHGDSFTLPDGAVHLASTSTCPNQAFRYGEQVYGLQFHLEVDAPIIDRWFHMPSLQDDIASMQPPLDFAQVQRETAQYIPRAQQLSGLVFNEFFRFFDFGGSKTILSSR